MARYVLHSLLILVIAQLANVAMGLALTERQEARVRHELAELREAIELTQKSQIPVLQVTAVTPTEGVRLTGHELAARVRALPRQWTLPEEATAERNLSEKTREAWRMAGPDTERYFHELCRLTI